MATASVPSPVNYSPVVDEVVLQAFLRKTFDSTFRKRILTDQMKTFGVFDDSDAHVGKYVEQRARIGNRSGEYRTELATRTFDRAQQYVTYTVPFSQFEARAMLSENDIAFMSGKQSAIVALKEKVYTDLSEDLNRSFNRQLLRSNAGTQTTFGLTAAAASPIPFFGFPTLFGAAATALAYNPDTQSASTGSVTATATEVVPNFAYCGISTHPTTAISGVDGKVNESTSPILVNWSSTAFNTSGSTTWQNNCLDVLSHVSTRFLARTSDMEDIPSLVLTTAALFEQTKLKIRNSQVQQHVVVTSTPSAPDVGMYQKMMVPYEGVNISVDIDMPTNAVYWINPRRMKFFILPLPLAGMPGADMFSGETKPWFKVAQANDIDVGAYKIVASMMGQLWLNPSCFAAAFNFA